MFIKKNIIGFSLLEVMLTISLLALIAAFSAPAFMSLQNRNDVDIATSASAQALRRAQSLSEAMWKDSEWSVHFENNQVTIFKGTTYSTRTTSEDDINNLSGGVTFSGLSNVTFSKDSGEPTSTGTITINGQGNETRIVTINAIGAVSY